MKQYPYKNKNFFHAFAKNASAIVGSPRIFIFSVLFIIAWLVCGVWFEFSDSWQLIINTTISIITFLIVFLIQNTQNRDARDIQIKIDELILATKKARNSVIDLDNLSDDQLEELEKTYKRLSKTTENFFGYSSQNGEEMNAKFQ